MVGSSRDIQLLKLKDMIVQLNTTIKTLNDTIARQQSDAMFFAPGFNSYSTCSTFDDDVFIFLVLLRTAIWNLLFHGLCMSPRH